MGADVDGYAGRAVTTTFEFGGADKGDKGGGAVTFRTIFGFGCAIIGPDGGAVTATFRAVITTCCFGCAIVIIFFTVTSAPTLDKATFFIDFGPGFCLARCVSAIGNSCGGIRIIGVFGVDVDFFDLAAGLFGAVKLATFFVSLLLRLLELPILQLLNAGELTRFESVSLALALLFFCLCLRICEFRASLWANFILHTGHMSLDSSFRSFCEFLSFLIV